MRHRPSLETSHSRARCEIRPLVTHGGKFHGGVACSVSAPHFLPLLNETFPTFSCTGIFHGGNPYTTATLHSKRQSLYFGYGVKIIFYKICKVAAGNFYYGLQLLPFKPAHNRTHAGLLERGQTCSPCLFRRSCLLGCLWSGN